MTRTHHTRTTTAFFLLLLASTAWSADRPAIGTASVSGEETLPGSSEIQTIASISVPAQAADPANGVFVAIPATLTLDECLKLAAENNRTVLASRARTSAGRAKANQVFRTQLPNASVSAQDTKYREPNSPALSDRQDTERFSLNETFQPFGRYRSQSRAANASVEAAVADERRTLVDVAFQVSKAFYDMVLADDLIRVASDSVDQRQKHRDHTQRLVDAGTAPRFDLLRAEVQLSAARPALIKAVHSR